MARFWWRRSREIAPATYSAIAGDVRAVIDEEAGRGPALAGFLGLGPPVVSHAGICVNGARPRHHDSFVFARVVAPGATDAHAAEPGDAVWDCCDTGDHPYGEVVSAVLAVVARRLQESFQYLASDERFELIAQAARHAGLADENPGLDVPLVGGLGEVCRGDEGLLVIDDDALGVQA